MVPPWATAITSLPACFGVDPQDGAAHAVVEIHETFAARSWLADIGEPWLPTGRLAMNAARFMPCHCPRCCSAKHCLLRHRSRSRKSGSPDCLCECDPSASDCWKPRPRCAAGFFRPLRTPLGRRCRSRGPSGRRCSHCPRVPARDAPTTIAWSPPRGMVLPGWTSFAPFNKCPPCPYVRARTSPQRGLFWRLKSCLNSAVRQAQASINYQGAKCIGRLEGKSVIITGAGSGIGRAASLLFTKEGPH